jgi:hypothetical protein
VDARFDETTRKMKRWPFATAAISARNFSKAGPVGPVKPMGDKVKR